MAEDKANSGESEGLRVTREAIARAVERSNEHGVVNHMSAVDPAFAAMLDALPVGWEVGHYTRQQQAAARGFRAATRDLEGVTIMSETEAVVETIEQPEADPKAAETARQNEFVAQVMGRVAFMFRTSDLGLNFMVEADNNVVVDINGVDGVRVFAYYQRIYDSTIKQFATSAAKQLGHDLTAWTFSGDERIGDVALCQNCGDVGYLPKAGGRGGRPFGQRCVRAPGVPGSLANVKAHMDRAGLPTNEFPDTGGPSTEWTDNEDSRR